MSKRFTYTKIDTVVYDGERDDYEEYGVEFEYEVDDAQLLEEVVDLVFEDYFSKNDEISGYVGRTVSVKDGIKNFIKDYDLLDRLVDDYEDALKEIFEQEALDSYND